MNPIFGKLIEPVADLISEWIPDADKRDALAHQIATMAETHAHENAMGQMEVNKAAAQHGSIFVAGARPAILWICALALLFNTIIHPIMSIWYELPPVDADLLYPVMLSLLGIGGYRAWEKGKGVARESLRGFQK